MAARLGKGTVPSGLNLCLGRVARGTMAGAGRRRVSSSEIRVGRRMEGQGLSARSAASFVTPKGVPAWDAKTRVKGGADKFGRGSMRLPSGVRLRKMVTIWQCERLAHRRRWKAASVIAPLALAGCAGAPAHNILGSFFPSWMICVLAGIVAAILVRYGLSATSIDKTLPAPLLVYLAFTVFFSFATWLAWLG